MWWQRGIFETMQDDTPCRVPSQRSMCRKISLIRNTIGLKHVSMRCKMLLKRDTVALTQEVRVWSARRLTALDLLVLPACCEHDLRIF